MLSASRSLVICALGDGVVYGSRAWECPWRCLHWFQDFEFALGCFDSRLAQRKN